MAESKERVNTLYSIIIEPLAWYYYFTPPVQAMPPLSLLRASNLIFEPAKKLRQITLSLFIIFPLDA